jgi:peptide/nickel transport system ATP-binding protein
MQLRDETGMTLIFITHDIGLAYYVSDTVYIMEHGKFVESGTADERDLLRPQGTLHQALINDVPKSTRSGICRHGVGATRSTASSSTR